MKRLFLIVMVLLLLSGIGIVVWTAAGLPPVRMVWSYGFSCGPESTGRILTVEGVDFVEIGPGCFRMSDNEGGEGEDSLGRLFAGTFGFPLMYRPKPSEEMPMHWVEFPRGFWIVKNEVTNVQYEAFDPRHERNEYSPGDSDPVVDVSWEDAKKYCAWLADKSGRSIRLPSESEWECACRAGSDREFSIDDNEQRLGDYAWYDENSDFKAHAVGTRRANAWGLHDFHGNVWEWCEDTWHVSYEGAPADGTAWTAGGEEPEPDPPDRVIRGGSWYNPAESCLSVVRGSYHQVKGMWLLGFRPAFWPSEN